MNKQNAESCHARWARLRFTVIGTLLASPPPKGQLKDALAKLAKTQWLHPDISLPITEGLSTIERWYYRAKEELDPVATLRHKQRDNAGQQRAFGHTLQQALKAQYKSHKGWRYQLHADNLKALSQQQPELGETPSYSTVRRYMKAQGLIKQRRILQRSTAATLAAEQRLETREVRSYEVDYVHGLWHLDFHHCSRSILMEDGRWSKPLLLAVMDDRSRIICHAQWYWYETAECLSHAFAQAVQKRALPRELLTDNGAAMVSAEFTQGLERLGILHKTTLPYSPYQNGKQAFFWTNIEGR
jgi:transposase InsO family protein